MRDGGNLSQAEALRTTEDRRARIGQEGSTEAGVEASVQLSLLSWVAGGWECWSEVTGRETMSFSL